jgi:Tol biopolymer transport system component
MEAKMKKILRAVMRLGIFSIMLCVLLSGHYSQQTAGERYEKALFLEEVKGDLPEAIVLYKEIIIQFSDEREIAAKAQLHIGLCYEKLGHTEAVKAYELVLQKYADQSEQVVAARIQLAALRAKKPGGLTVTKIEGPEGSFDVQTFSPDGTKMAVVVIAYKEGQNIAVYDLINKRIEQVTHFDWINPTYNAIWSPDGKKIAFKRYMGFRSSLMVSNLDGKASSIINVKKGYLGLYDWLPDGSAVVASLKEDKATNLVLIPVAGGDYKTLHVLEGDFHSDVSAAIADASPDGKYIVFADGPKREEQNIYCIGSDGQFLQVLTDHAANDIQPRWSPDGKYVVFLSFRSGTKALWGIRVNKGEPEEDPFIIQEMGRGTSLLDWTSRGLAYRNYVNMWDVWMVPVNPETGEPTDRLEQLDYFPPGGNRGAVWSPDGKHLAFFSAEGSGQPGQGYIVVMPADGGPAREYLIPMDTFFLNTLGELRWMPDSSGLGFYGPGEKGATMFRLTIASEKWETWPIPTPGWTKTEWSPDGKAFLYAKGGLIKRDLETEEEQFVYKNYYDKEKKAISIVRHIRFSRDYKKLFFFTTDIKYENKKMEPVGVKIMELDISTGQAWTIDTDNISDLSTDFACSPDRKNLAVLNKVEDKPSEMFIVPLQDGKPKKVELIGCPQKASLHITDWSTDGKLIAFETRRSGMEIFMMKNVIPEKQK